MEGTEVRDEIKKQSKIAQDLFNDGANLCQAISKIMDEDEEHNNPEDTGNFCKTTYTLCLSKHMVQAK